MVRSPVEICFGTRPSHAAKSRPFEKPSPLPIPATIALEMIGPMPGTVISRSQPRLVLSQRLNLSRDVLDPPVEVMPVVGEVLDRADHARRQNVGARGEQVAKLSA